MKLNTIDSYRSPSSLSGLPQSSPVLLAFSGGEDSRVLFDLLLKDSKKNGFILHIAHFNHSIRGEEAERDASFCERLANEHGLPFHLEKADVPALAKESGNSLETEARIRRYAFFEKIMRDHNIPILATAHHADDQVESILLHVLRGSGLNGLVGISACRPLSDGLFVTRPLIYTEKSEISAYRIQNGLEFVTDSTNTDTDYSRNHLRANVTPEMKKLQPSLCKVFERLAQNAAESEELISSCSLEFVTKHCFDGMLPLDEFNKQHTVIKARVLSSIFEKHSKKSLERVHIESVIELCEKAISHSSISLPDGISARVENGCLVFITDFQDDRRKPFYIPFCEGSFKMNDFKIIIEKNAYDKYSFGESVDVRCDLISKDAHFRPRKDGDVILNNNKHKKVKKLLNEKSIPLTKRKDLPFLVSNEEILWIPTVAACDSIKSGTINDGEDFFRITVIFENN